MMELREELISSAQNPKIKTITKLKKRRERDKSQSFLIEGYRENLRAVEGGSSFQSLFICPEFFLGENEEALIEQIQKRGARVFCVAPEIFSKVSQRDRPDGLLSIAPQKKLGLEDLEQILEKESNPLLIVAESIEKPGNLGTILRSADAVGAHAVLVCDRCTDIHNPNVVRASVGTLFTIPVIDCSGAKTLEFLKEKGIRLASSTPAAENVYTKVNLSGPIAIAVGTEQLGLSKSFLDAADIQVHIPMMGKADSLNAAMATTLLMYEALRQRSK